MNEILVLIGVILLVVSVFGYTYSGQQQGVIDQAEQAITGEGQDWELLQSISLAGTALGTLIIIAGLIPQEWYRDKF